MKSFKNDNKVLESEIIEIGTSNKNSKNKKM